MMLLLKRLLSILLPFLVSSSWSTSTFGRQAASPRSTFLLFLTLSQVMLHGVQGGYDDFDVNSLILEGISTINDRSQMNPTSLSKATKMLEHARNLIFKEEDPQMFSNPKLVANMYYSLGMGYFKSAQFYLNPTQYEILEKGTSALEEALSHRQPGLLQTFEKPKFWQLLGRLYYLMQHKCYAADNAYIPWLYDHFEGEISKLGKDDRFLVVDAITNCHPDNMTLWEDMLTKGYISAQDAASCISCFTFMFATSLRVDPSGKQAQQLFDKLQLDQYTPWKHYWQIPSQMNTALISDQPQPFLNTSDYPVCQALEAAASDIQEEYANYQAYVKEHPAALSSQIEERHHMDSALSHDHTWTHIYLARNQPVEGSGVGWNDEVCREFFPQTCAAIRDKFPEVDGKLLHSGNGDEYTQNCGNHDNDGYMDYCKQTGALAGSVQFLKLPPQGKVYLHSGTSNQRLKCHLVVKAPPVAFDDDGMQTSGSWIEVAGQKLAQSTGKVFAWDDSYYHQVYNDGNEERVVLDVTFWHPDLMTDLHTSSYHTEL